MRPLVLVALVGLLACGSGEDPAPSSGAAGGVAGASGSAGQASAGGSEAGGAGTAGASGTSGVGAAGESAGGHAGAAAGSDGAAAGAGGVSYPECPTPFKGDASHCSSSTGLRRKDGLVCDVCSTVPGGQTGTPAGCTVDGELCVADCHECS